jgi:hypothetical protein
MVCDFDRFQMKADFDECSDLRQSTFGMLIKAHRRIGLGHKTDVANISEHWWTNEHIFRRDLAWSFCYTQQFLWIYAYETMQNVADEKKIIDML